MRDEAGTYSFVVSWHGSTRVTVEAENELEAYDKAADQAEEPWDWDITDIDLDDFKPYPEPTTEDHVDLWIRGVREQAKRRDNEYDPA